MQFDSLLELVRCHSTPGDEDEVRAWLTDHFQTHGWTVTGHGQYALSASRPGSGKRPRLLITAHMDSPGYIVERLDNKQLTCIALGSPHFAGDQAEAVVRSGHRRLPVLLAKAADADSKPVRYQAKAPAGVRHGDRVCFPANPKIVADEFILSPFLDNRLGCFLLAELAAKLPAKLPVDVILGATASEEMGGFGAPVLASAVNPDLVACLDATYEDEAQKVKLGDGPVLTLSDASVLLGSKLRDRIQAAARQADVSLQTEVYNYSGTDSRAFPHQGLTCPVLALLIPTRGNHSPVELASLRDIEALFRLLQHWCVNGLPVNIERPATND